MCPDVSRQGSAAARIAEDIWSTGQAGSFILFLLSGGTVEYAHIPDPRAVAERMARAISRGRGDGLMKRSPLPTVRNGVPREIVARLSREATPGAYGLDPGRDAAGPRWRMIFRASFEPGEE